jgi:hypothetical protein
LEENIFVISGGSSASTGSIIYTGLLGGSSHTFALLAVDNAGNRWISQFWTWRIVNNTPLPPPSDGDQGKDGGSSTGDIFSPTRE